MNTQGVWENPELAGERAVELVEAGNTACKLDPFRPITGPPKDYSLKFIRHVAKIFRAIRDAVGDELEIGIGAHGQFSTAGAIRVASILEEFDPYWFKSPCRRKTWMRWPAWRPTRVSPSRLASAW